MRHREASACAAAVSNPFSNSISCARSLLSARGMIRRRLAAMTHLADIYRTSLALLTDLYELTMAYGFWKLGRLDEAQATGAEADALSVAQLLEDAGEVRARIWAAALARNFSPAFRSSSVTAC